MKPVPRSATLTMAGGIGASHQSTSKSRQAVSRTVEPVRLVGAVVPKPSWLRPTMSSALYGPMNGVPDCS
ncbi:MAG: hypothetical protein KatS3mg063_0584 [Tepidiforma sp.]|uniref:hypothetical protein n=1 Tax=Tepidiforma sp. TaxID=2682230 RepID=UPI0021DE07B0|nr:hypothetical protein [Tepidiforma sp.]GIW14731.1 MAG: hypothetical protein KatS3mg063_0584 [Tepidiforma sp.]